MTNTPLTGIGELTDPAGQSWGTAFLISETYALTTMHCLDQVDQDMPDVTEADDAEVAIRLPLSSGATVVRAKVEEVDSSLDVALLRVISALPSDVSPIRLGTETTPLEPFRAVGFPVLEGPVHESAVMGTSNGITTMPDGPSLLSLHCGEPDTDMPLHGLSGGPVLVGAPERAVGIVRWQQPSDAKLAAGGTFFATPMADVLTRWPQLRDLATTSERPTYRALLIGNSRFPRSLELPALPSAVDNVSLVQAALTHAEAGVFAETRVIIDGTAEQLRRELERFASLASPDDRLLVYYSGRALINGEGTLALCAHDTSNYRDALSSALIAELLESKAASSVLVVDCQQHGAGRGTAGQFAGPRRGVLMNAADSAAGSLTSALITSLLTAQPAEDGHDVLFDDLMAHLRQTLPPEETPQWMGLPADFAVARRRSHGPVELTAPPLVTTRHRKTSLDVWVANKSDTTVTATLRATGELPATPHRDSITLAPQEHASVAVWLRTPRPVRDSPRMHRIDLEARTGTHSRSLAIVVRQQPGRSFPLLSLGLLALLIVLSGLTVLMFTDRGQQPPQPERFHIEIGKQVSRDEPEPGAGSLDTTKPADIYEFDGVAGQRIYPQRLDCENEQFRTTVELIGPDGQPIPSENGQNFLSCGLAAAPPWRLPATGQYELRVSLEGHDNQSATYSFRLVESPETRLTLPLGQTIHGDLPAPQSINSYTVHGEAKQHLAIDVQLDCGNATRLELHDPHGRVLLDRPDLDGCRRSARTSTIVTVPDTADYTLTITSGTATNANAFGRYTLRVRPQR